MNRMMQPAMVSGNANLVQGAFGQTTLQTQPGFPGVPPPMAGGQGMPSNTMDTTQNPYLQTPLSFNSSAMRYLLSLMPQPDADAIRAQAGRLGDAGRVIMDRTGGMLSQVRDKFNPGTPSTMAPVSPGPAAPSPSDYSAPATPGEMDALGDAVMQAIPEDNPMDPRYMNVGGPAGGHPVNPYNPFELLPPELHLHAMHLMQTQGVSAEAACREIYDNFNQKLIQDMNALATGNPDRGIDTEDWSQLDPGEFSKPTSYMHHALKHSDYFQDLATRAWEALGKPTRFSEAETLKILQHALGQGKHQEVLDLHNSVPHESKLDSVGELLEPYREWLEGGGRAFDLFSDMPPINQYQLPPEMQPRNLAHLDQLREDIVKHLRDRNYENPDIQYKLDELFLDLGGSMNRRQSRWS
jgi:hypothetical protein